MSPSRGFLCITAVLVAACNTTRYQARPVDVLPCNAPYVVEAINHTIWPVDVYGPGSGQGTFLGSLDPGETNSFKTFSAAGFRWVRHDPSPAAPAPANPTNAAQNQLGVTFRAGCG